MKNKIQTIISFLLSLKIKNEVLVKREINRFLSLYKQTIIPGVISSGLYIIVFGHALGSRIRNNEELTAAGGYMLFIIPGLIASWMDKQGVSRTISVVLIQASLVHFILMLIYIYNV